MLWWIFVGYLGLMSTMTAGLLLMILRSVLQARRLKSPGVSEDAEAAVADTAVRDLQRSAHHEGEGKLNGEQRDLKYNPVATSMNTRK